MPGLLYKIVIAAVFAVAAAPSVSAQVPNDLYYDFQVEKRGVPTYVYCIRWEWAVHAGHSIDECFNTALERDRRVMQLKSSGARILEISEGLRVSPAHVRWRFHSVEDTLARARSIANLLEGTGQWETRITPVYAPFSFLVDRYPFGLR
ncbi:MAG: hypothetical protein ACR2NP_04800 [Pirellulaceae bacterium]